MKITPQELNERLKWTLKQKVEHCIYTFLEFYVKNNGDVYLSFSGGKDSQVLEYIIKGIFEGKWEKTVTVSLLDISYSMGDMQKEEREKYFYRSLITERLFGGEPPKVFCDTGLEFPEIRKHVKKFDNVTWMKPAMKFPDVIKHVGVAVGSKSIAMQIRRVQSYLLNPKESNSASLKLYTTGIKSDGSKSSFFGLKKWMKLLDAPFKTSDKCCDIFKKDPFKVYEKMTGRKPITATNVSESMQRRSSYMKTGCNTFEKGKEMSRPMSIFTDNDVWEFAKLNDIEFCEVYYDRTIMVPDGMGGEFEMTIEGENRTGCMFCLFGVHLDDKKKLNRFQRMALTHPKQYKFMVDVCGLGTVLEYINVDYKIDKDKIIADRSQYTFFKDVL